MTGFDSRCPTRPGDRRAWHPGQWRPGRPGDAPWIKAAGRGGHVL